jgi:hypothetical protein
MFALKTRPRLGHILRSLRIVFGILSSQPAILRLSTVGSPQPSTVDNLFGFNTYRKRGGGRLGLSATLFCSYEISNLCRISPLCTLARKTPGGGGVSHNFAAPHSGSRNPCRITSLYRHVRELPWNQIVAKNRGVGWGQSPHSTKAKSPARTASAAETVELRR